MFLAGGTDFGPAACLCSHTVTALQTDGWLSEKSASIYEASTETLFLGRQDAMQRQCLVPLHNFMQGKGREGASTKMLEVACGTGRFATFVKVSPGHCVCGRGRGGGVAIHEATVWEGFDGLRACMLWLVEWLGKLLSFDATACSRSQAGD